jgi:hypothetical protein
MLNKLNLSVKLVGLLLLVFFTEICFSQTVAGVVLDTDTKKPLFAAYVFLIEQKPTEDTVNIYYLGFDKHKIVSAARTSPAGTYKFSGMPENVYNVVAEYEMPPNEKFGWQCAIRYDIDSNIIVRISSHYHKTINLRVTCPYDKTQKQQYCPVCNKKDKVKFYLYGLPIYDKNGQIPDRDKYYFGGCIADAYCNPSKHCLRCNKDF